MTYELAKELKDAGFPHGDLEKPAYDIILVKQQTAEEAVAELYIALNKK